jgi:hypothetical protein
MLAHCAKRETAASQEEILAHLDRIFASTTFRDSAKIEGILAFIVRETLDGRGSQIKEYTIGLDVYWDRPSHDSSPPPDLLSIIGTAVGRLERLLITAASRKRDTCVKEFIAFSPLLSCSASENLNV